MPRELILSEYTAALANARRVRDVWQMAQDFARARGFDKLSYHAVRPVLPDAPDPGDAVVVSANGFPDDWVRHYVDNRLLEIDPIPRLALTSAAPFRWSDVGTKFELRPAEKRFLRMAREAGLGDGLALQCFGPTMRSAYVGVGFGPDPGAIGPAAVWEMQAAAQLTHLAVCRLVDERMNYENRHLSDREREVMRLVVRGLSNATIAEEIGVSRHTVDALLRRIFAKLDVTDRTSAALRAVTSGIVGLPGQSGVRPWRRAAA